MRGYFKKSLILSILTCGLLSAALIGISQAKDDSAINRTTTTEGTTVATTTVHESDSPYIGDPLGNGPVTSKANAGPSLTRRPYSDSCSEDRCIRAKQRQLGGTTWQHDRATGLNKGFGAGD